MKQISEALNKSRIIPINKLTENDEDKIVIVRGWINTVRETKYVTFIALREYLDTIQCVIENNDNILDGIILYSESFIEIEGKIKVVKKAVKGCTISNIEINVSKLRVISESKESLPFSMKDAAATEDERKRNKSICNVGYNLRLDHRFLDFRLPQSLAIIRVIDSVMFSFRDYLRKNEFIEIKTTKIIQSGSEGGANLFSMDYFGKKAYLAQSPQLYKQMAIAGGLKRVYEVGHVYRAEQSNVNRYLSEFTGLDIEMEIETDYMDVIKFIYKMFVHIFDSLKKDCARELEIIRNYKHFEDIKYENEPLILTFQECIKLLHDSGFNIKERDDFSREAERKLGEIVKNKYSTDFFIVINYPEEQRAFYTYYDKKTKLSHSYDFILRGEEILSGAERISNPTDLTNAVIARGIDVKSISFYIDCFKYGVPPHAGCGIGLERLLKSFFNFDDIRYFSLYPRDQNRIYP